MANKNLSGFRTRPAAATPQSQPLNESQVANNAGGYVFRLSTVDWVKRFLILGSNSSFYRTGAEMTKDSANALITLAQNDHATLLDSIIEVSTAGRAVKQSPGLFALAIACSYGTTEEKQRAIAAIPAVARTGSTLFEFIGYVSQFRGMGRALAKGIASWYNLKSPDQVAYQMAKYRQRGGYTHRDVYRMVRPAAHRMDQNGVQKDPARQAIGDWLLHDKMDFANLPFVITAFEGAKTTEDLPGLIRDAKALSWEMLPTERLNDAAVWEALLETNKVPLGALLRQLPRLTNAGIFSTPSLRDEALRRLTDTDELHKARIHPMQILIALKTYASGRSIMGKGTWVPNPKVIDALDAAYYEAYSNIEPTGLRYLVGLDVSGSMGAPVAGLPISAREATTALAMQLVATEENVQVIGFTAGSVATFKAKDKHPSRSIWGRDGGVTELAFSRRQRLDDAVRTTARLPFGDTDTALPMRYAAAKNLDVDVFITMTDSETWAGDVHTSQALAKYRKQSGINAKNIVLATTATEFTIADPNDPGQMDIAGFDTTVPQVIAEFAKGL